MPRRYQKFTRAGRIIKRRLLTAAEQKARKLKFQATMERRRASKLQPETGRAKARRAALEELGPARTAPPPAHHHARRGAPHKGNGRADARVPDVEGAAFWLHRAEDWIIAARYMGTLPDLDLAHRYMLVALGILEGLTPPI